MAFFDVSGAKKAGYSDDDIARYLAEQKNFDYSGAIGAGYTASEIVDFLGKPDRTVAGQVGETLKGVGRGFAGAFLSAGEGLAELADAATNVVGLEGLIDSGDENELVKASRAGRDWINNSFLGADPSYQDAWWTKFGEGVGSMASFLTPTAILRGLGAVGKATRLGMGRNELAAAATLAGGAGAGDQAQRIAAARAQGIEVSEGQEDASIALGGLAGLSEIAPITLLLKRVPKNVTPAEKYRILDLLRRSLVGGLQEGLQEAGAGIAQDLIEKGIYNENLPLGESLWDDFTVGGAVGAFTDFVINAAAGRRSFITTDAQREYEAKLRERREANIQKIQQALVDAEQRRATRQADPAGFVRAAEAAQANAANIAAPQFDGPDIAAGEAYARTIANELGDFFPTNVKFEVKEAPPTVTSRGTLPNGETIVEQTPNFIVVDSNGKQYGQAVQSREQAAGLAYGLNNEVIDSQVRGQVLNILENSGESYSPEAAATLMRYGYQILNPEANMITSAALNEAAGTTVDKGYIENYSFQTILDGEQVKEDGKTVGYKIQGPNGTTVVPGLTLSQQINQKRKEQGLPETQVFTIDEARNALGDKFENLTNINVLAVPDGMTYTASIVPTQVEVSKGKKATVNIPSVVSSAGEVIQTRFATQEDSDASGKKEDGSPNIKVGQKIELKSLEDAQAFAERKNREAARGQGLSVQEVNALMKGEKNFSQEINRLLKSKNIGSKTDSPEVKALFKSIIGKESLSDMTSGEQRLLYARLRNLPTFEGTVKLPLFEAKPYTRDNFLRASKFIQDANALDQRVTDEQIAEAAGLLPEDARKDLKVQALKKDLEAQGVSLRKAERPVLFLPAPTAGATDTYNFLREELRKKMKGFGLDDIAARIDETLLNFADPVRYMEEMGVETEGYYNPFLREITLALDRVDPQKTLTPEQRLNALTDVLNHEVVHAAREMDLWTDKEWDTVSNASARLKRLDASGNPTNETYLQWARRTYPDQSPLIQEEEAVADANRQFRTFGDKAVSGKPKALLKRLTNLFERLDNSFRGAGFQSYSDIFNRLQSGEIGGRTRGEIRTLRETEAEMAREGVLPERFADYQPIIANPVLRNQEREERKVQIQQKAQTSGVTDFNPAALEGAAIRESRSSIEKVPANIEVEGRLRPTRDSENRVIYSGYEGPDIYQIQTAPTEQGLRNFWRWFGDSKAVSRDGRPSVYYHGTAADITEFRPKQAGSVFVTKSPSFANEFAGMSEDYMVGNFTDFMSDQQVLDVLNETLESQSAFAPKTWDKVAKLRDSVANSVAAGRPITAKTIEGLTDVATEGRSSRFAMAIQTRLPSAGNLVPVYVKAENPFDYQNEDHVKRVLKKADELSPTPLGAFEAEGVFNGDWGVIETPTILQAIKDLGFDSMYVEEAGQKNLAVFEPNQVKSAIGNNGEFSPLTPSIRESRQPTYSQVGDSLVGPVVSTRVPTAKPRGKKAVPVESATDTRLQIGLETFQQDPALIKKAADLIVTYPNLKSVDRNLPPDQIVERFVDHIKNNLLWLYDNVPSEIRDRSKLWYVGANRIANYLSDLYGISPDQAAAVLAVNSPQTEWFTNVTRGERIIDIWFNQQDFKWSPEMEATANKIFAKPRYKKDLNAIRGKSLEDIKGSPEEKLIRQAMWIRTYDQSNNLRNFRIIAPEGSFGEFVMTEKGNPAIAAWGSLDSIAKSISILESGSPVNISNRLGNAHKVRSFYNNIIAPEDTVGDVTIDTHAVAAGLLRPLSGNSIEVAHNLGAGVGNAFGGIKGLYGIYAEAYRRAAAERDVLPREMQSITWEAIRGTFTDVFKRSQKANVIENAWRRYRDGQLSDNEIRDIVIQESGGINEPDWWQSNRNAPEETWSSTYGGKLSPFRVSGRGASPRTGRVDTRSARRDRGGSPPAEQRLEIRESRIRPRSEAQLEDAVKKAEEDIAKTPTGSIPLYDLNASPDALYVAQNPDAGEQLNAEEFVRYSRKNEPTYSPGIDQIIGKLAAEPPNQTPGQTIIEGLALPPYRQLIQKFRKEFVFNYAQLEYWTKRHPSLMHNTADSNALVAAEFSDRNKAFTAAAIKHGVPVYENGIVKIKDFVHNGKRYRGLAEVMVPLFSKEYGNLEKLAQSYAIAIRGRRLVAEGKLAPALDPAEFARLEAEVNRFINPSTGQPIIKEWYDAWQAYNGYVIQFLRDTGMIDDAGAELWAEQSDYIPFYRETKDGSGAYAKVFGGLTSTTHLKAVGKSAEAIDMPLLEAVITNLDAAIAMGMKNVAQQRIVRDMIQIGLGRMVRPGESTEGLPTVTFKVQGKKYTAIIDDPLIFESMQALPEIGLSGVLETVFRAPANLLREMITREPGYMLANIMRDTASVTFTSQASLGSTIDAVRSFSQGFEQLERGGVIGGYDFARDPENMTEFLAKEAKKMGHEIPEYGSTLGNISRSKYLKPFTWIWDAAGKLSDKAEALNRIRVYEDTLKNTGNEAEALYQALSVINYGRRGRSPVIRTLTAVVPFLNARIQGLDKLYQAGTGQFGPTTNRRKNAINFAARASLMVGLTMYYYSMVSDDDEYKNANPEVLDNYYIFPTGMGFAIRIPIPFEVGLLFKTLPERIMRLSDGTDTFRDARQSAARAVTSTLAFNPIPQAVLPIAEIYTNYDTFTGRSIVPPYMDQRMAAEYQSRFGTNELARMLGEATGISPIKIDHLLNGYFGSIGTYTLDAIDSVLRDNDRAYPARDIYEYPFIRRFFADANQPGLQSQFYDLSREVDKVTNTIRELKKDGRTDELNAYIMENQNLIAVKRNVAQLNKVMEKYRKQKDAVLKSPLDPEVKKEIVDQLDASINTTLQVMPILRRIAFGGPE